MEFPVTHNPMASFSGGPDPVSRDMERRTALVVTAVVGGLGIGLLSLLLAGPKGVLPWLGFAVVGLAAWLLLLRWFEAGVVAFLGVCWIAVGSPALAQGGSGGGAQQLKISQLGLLALLGIWGTRRFFGRVPLSPSPLNRPILFYLVVCLWSTLNGILFPNQLVLANGPRQFVQVNILEILIRVLALGGLLLIADTLRGRTLKVGAAMAILPGVLTFTGLLPFIPSSTYLAFPQILSMAVLAAVALTGDGWAKPLLRVVCGLLSLAILLVYFLKGAEWVSGWLGALVAVGVICFTARRKLFWAGIAAIVLVVALNFPFFYDKVYKSNFYGSGPTQDRSRIGHMGTFTNDRTRMIGAAIRYADNFPLGIGLGNYRSYNKYFGRVEVWNTTTFTSAHGTYAQALSETGWPGLVALLGLLIACGRTLRTYYVRLPSGWGRTYVLGAYGGVVGVFCASFNGDYLFPTYHNGGMGSFGACAYTWLLIGVCLAIARDYGLEGTDRPRKADAANVAPRYRHGPHALPAADPATAEPHR